MEWGNTTDQLQVNPILNKIGDLIRSDTAYNIMIHSVHINILTVVTSLDLLLETMVESLMIIISLKI